MMTIKFISMAQHTSTGRFRRLSHTSQLRKHNSSIFDGDSSQIVKLPALRAINKSIKYNDLSFATHRNMDKLPKQPEQVNNIEEVSAHHSLISMRKKYDTTNRQKEALQTRVKELEATRDELLAQKNGFENGKEDGGNRVNELKGELNDIKGLLEEGDMERKVMLSMMNRLKSDKVTYDLRKYNLEKELEQIHRQRKAIERQRKGISEEEDKTKKMFGKFVKHIQSQKRQRQTHLGNLSTMVYNKQGSVEMDAMKQSSMMGIAAAALQQKMPQQKKWQKIYSCQKFVERILRDKMQREMMKFNVVETAFKQIKTATGVSSADELVSKYLNKESAYGDLLGKISQNQRTIVDIKSNNQQLAEEEKRLQREKENLNANRIESQDLTKEEKEYESISEKLCRCEGLYQRIKIYLSKAMRQFAQFESGKAATERTLEAEEVKAEAEEGTKTPQKQAEEASKLDQTNKFSHVSDLFKAYLQQIEGNMKFEVEQEKGFDGSALNADENVRINFEEEEEEKAPRMKTKVATQQNEQGDFLDNQWNQLHLHNQKFMKQVRRRVQAERQARIEAEPKKKPVVEAKPVPPPIQQ